MISYASSSPEIFEQITYLSLVHLHTDIAHLTRVLDEQIFAKILNKINALGSLAAEQKEAIKSSTNIVLKRLHEPTANIAGHVQSHLIEKSLENVKQVGDIPRQYRRTNRAEPTEPSQYVSSLIVPCQKYFDDTKDESKWIGTIFTAITKDYQRAIEEVLEASRKMEASLLKLKQMRKTKTEEKSDKMSDDEKIRLQIRLDVTHFGESFFKLGVESDHASFVELNKLVQS